MRETVLWTPKVLQFDHPNLEMPNYRINPVFEIEIKDGWYEMSVPDQLRLKKYCLSNSGTRQLVIRHPKKKKNRKYENWYWGVFVPIIQDYMGEEDPKYVHAIMKNMHLKKIKVIKGKEYEAVGSTSGMSSEAHGNFVERCVLWATRDVGLEIPEPDPNHGQTAEWL